MRPNPAQTRTPELEPSCGEVTVLRCTTVLLAGTVNLQIVHIIFLALFSINAGLHGNRPMTESFACSTPVIFHIHRCCFL